MLSNLNLALLITLFGMGLVFAAILLLWAVMALLVHFTSREEPANAKEAPSAQPELERKRRAAAVAVALALAEQSDSMRPHEFPLPPTALVSAWQAVMRTRMLSKRGPTR